MNPQSVSARRARFHFNIILTRRVARASAVTAALVLALFLAPAGKTSADDDVERSVAMMAKIGFANSPSFSPEG